MSDAMTRAAIGAASARPTACLALADGTVFMGRGFGATGVADGELCFNTAMTGYQEIMTDPSYAGQIVTFTFPHIGNTGANAEDDETADPVALGMVVKWDPTEPSSWRAAETLSAWLAKRGRIAIGGIDTRRLTRAIRLNGAPHAAIEYREDGNFDVPALVARAKAFPGLEGMDLAKEVSCVLALNPEGVFLSNGPGDPAATGVYAVPMIKGVLAAGLPVFGICLGHQMLALALGGKTVKMSHGHHGANHPVKDLTTGKVEITSMNHGFAVDAQTLPDGVEETHVSLFDGSNCGIAMKGRPVFSVQHHPEASPGPQDSFYLFERFIASMA